MYLGVGLPSLGVILPGYLARWWSHLTWAQVFLGGYLLSVIPYTYFLCSGGRNDSWVYSTSYSPAPLCIPPTVVHALPYSVVYTTLPPQLQLGVGRLHPVLIGNLLTSMGYQLYCHWMVDWRECACVWEGTNLICSYLHSLPWCGNSLCGVWLLEVCVWKSVRAMWGGAAMCDTDLSLYKLNLNWLLTSPKARILDLGVYMYLLVHTAFALPALFVCVQVHYILWSYIVIGQSLNRLFTTECLIMRTPVQFSHSDSMHL